MHISGKTISRRNANSENAHAVISTVSAVLVGLALSGLYVHRQTNRAEREHPPFGKFIEVNGVRLHFIDTGGSGPALVMFHGNGAMIADMQISGLVEAAAQHYRVIVFDRPGYGYSDRPRDRVWGPAEQADLFRLALAQLGISRPLVFGHSWGTEVALALALNHPDDVGGLVLASGYYFPTARADTLTAAPSVIPLVGDLLRHTVAPLIGRLSASSVFRKMFAPQQVTQAFREQFPVGLTLRPSQIRASAEETLYMAPAAGTLETRYHQLRAPVFIIAGAEDRIVDVESQSCRLHRAVAQSEIRVLPSLGHMLHHFVPGEVLSAIDAVAIRAS